MKIKMMRKSLLTGMTCLLILSACNENFLETQPLDKISSSATWSDGKLSEAFVFSVYSYLGYGGFEEQALAAYTDEAMFTHAGRNINTFNEGSESPSNLAWRSGTYRWDRMYSAIRQANVAIANLPESTFGDDTLKDQLLGEALFLRAYYYHQLMRFYGGVPLIDTPYSLNEDYSIARSSFEETINFIVGDLDQATTLLDGKTAVDGRASNVSAMALKARVLLYAASDMHESSKAPSGYSGELHAYSSGSQATRWQAAATAAKAVLDATTGYKLDLAVPASPADGTKNYVSIAMGGESAVADASATSELIFQRTHTSDYTTEDNWPLGGIHYGVNNGPNGYHNWAGNTPIQQMVDDYEMLDGSSFDWNNPDHAAAPYENRDPRLDATILYDGATWKPRPSDVAGLDPNDQIQTGYYDDGNGGLLNGIDTRESSIENWNGTRTGYYTRKFIDSDPGIIDNLSNAQVIPWPFIRYTEMVLNYVEASIELGNEAEARAWLNKIRFRAGMPAVTDSGDALRDRYRNERRVELVYEEHRYHDVRRWTIPAETVGRGIQEINVIATLKAGQTAHTPYHYDPTVYDYNYEVQNNTEVESRNWNDKMYYRPIGRDEMNRNELLVQNPGY